MRPLKCVFGDLSGSCVDKRPYPTHFLAGYGRFPFSHSPQSRIISAVAIQISINKIHSTTVTCNFIIVAWYSLDLPQKFFTETGHLAQTNIRDHLPRRT